MHPRGSAEERSRPGRDLYPAPLPDAPPTEHSRLLQRGSHTPAPPCPSAGIVQPAETHRSRHPNQREGYGRCRHCSLIVLAFKNRWTDPRAEPVLSLSGLSIIGTGLRNRTVDRLFQFMSAETVWSACIELARRPCCIRDTPPPASRPGTGPRRDNRCASRRDLPEGRPRTRGS